MDKQLKKIATAARREMESFARKHNSIADASDLSCLCAISSYFLVILGKRLGYNLALVEGLAFDDDIKMLQYEADEETCAPGANHCWVEHGGKIIDITATQFEPSLKKVHVVDDDDENYYRMNRHNAARKCLRRDWPQCQTPYSHLPELRRRADKLKMKLAA